MRTSLVAQRERTSLLRVAIEPSGDNLPDFHTFVLGLISRRLRPTRAQQVAATATELLDNAMAYATMAQDIVVEVLIDTLGVFIEVSNDTVPSRIRVLEQRVGELQEAAEEVYVEEMRRSMAPRGPRSMMGLARIRHEAKMDLSLRVEGDRVTVVAQGRR